MIEERQILIGLITSTELCQGLQSIWEPELMESATAKRMARWVWQYYDQYGKAPGKYIEQIFQENQQKLPVAIAEEIEEDILPGLSREWKNQETTNLEYLLDESRKYFKLRKLQLHRDKLDSLLDRGKLQEAEELASSFLPPVEDSDTDMDLSEQGSLQRVEKAFDESSIQVIRYPGALGDFLNAELVRGRFVAFMGSEKRGKTFWLLDMAMRACEQGQEVAFFQAGDMTEREQVKRMGVYLCKKSNQKRYCGEMYQPIRDCIWNQLNSCKRPERECTCGLFDKKDEDYIRKEMQQKDLIAGWEEAIEKGYSPCRHCDDYSKNSWGSVWVEKINVGEEPLSMPEAKAAFEKFFVQKNRKMRISTHPNGTLTVRKMRSILQKWEKEGFIPKLIVVDYPDIMEDEKARDEREKQNRIWKQLRRLSQEKGEPLVVVVTQADAKSYDAEHLKLKNFSEDKRKYGHVTAFFGLNQDPKGREKRLGILRINEMVVREGDFSPANEVKVLQNLRRGRPFLNSMW